MHKNGKKLSVSEMKEIEFSDQRNFLIGALVDIQIAIVDYQLSVMVKPSRFYFLSFIFSCLVPTFYNSSSDFKNLHSCLGKPSK